MLYCGLSTPSEIAIALTKNFAVADTWMMLPHQWYDHLSQA